MKSQWSIKRLSEVAEIQMGQSPKGSSYNISGEGVPLINGPVEFGETPFSRTKRTKFTTEPTKMCREGDLILCVRGSTTGRMNIAGYDSCIGRGVASIRSEKYQDWINFFIHVNRETIYRLGSGATFPNVSGSMLAKLEIPIPPESEQKRIVAIMDEAFEGIDRAIANTEKNLANSRELFESYLNAIFTQKGDRWLEKKLKDLIHISHGYAFKGSDFETSNDEEKPIVLTPGNYSENGELYFTSKNTKRLICGSPPDGYLFNVGDLTVVMTDLSSKMKILGKPAFVDRPNILHNQRIGRIIFKDESINSRYLFYFLRTGIFANKIKETATGTMVRHTAPQRILSNKIPIPKYFDEQVHITSKLDELAIETQRLEAIYRQKIAALNELKQSILQKAFTGELTADTANQTTKAANEGIAA